MFHCWFIRKRRVRESLQNFEHISTNQDTILFANPDFQCLWEKLFVEEDVAIRRSLYFWFDSNC